MANCGCCGCVFSDSNTALIGGSGSSDDAFAYQIIDPTFYANRYALRRQKSALQSIPNNALTAIDFTTAAAGSFNRGFTFTAPSTFVILTSGIYIFGASVNFETNVTGTRYIDVLKNGTTIMDANESNSNIGSHSVSLSSTDKFLSNDTLQFRVLQNSGIALNAEFAGESSPVFWAVYIGKFV